jgi:RimJ/RimL family protein N-acetyltransferase
MTPDFTREEQLRWFARLQEMKDYRIWGVSLDEVLIGAAGLKKLTKEDGEYWGYIGEPRYWGLGLGRQIVSFVLDQARTLKLKKVFLHVHRDNLRALALYTSAGFQVRREVNEVLEMHVLL